ncbi:uncharacterized protein LOC113566438 [Drosophila persimilis]|uniref:uncharacterized protein LOC113566438 n=1 Tax=Drosophila persimilis TaxID=7234 RepID=UPI000F091E69|nr:uncharacterized protein LOC113566438 [Drosophila persimilis]
MLKERMDAFNAKDGDLKAYAAAHSFSVEFIPPRAPHIGGLWESAVKSAKNLLLRAMGSAVLKEDELHTVLVDVEAVLNSRPLVVDSGSPNEGEVVTPAHLLVGRTRIRAAQTRQQPLISATMAARVCHQAKIFERLVQRLSSQPSTAREVVRGGRQLGARQSGGNSRGQRAPSNVAHRNSGGGNPRSGREGSRGRD